MKDEGKDMLNSTRLSITELVGFFFLFGAEDKPFSFDDGTWNRDLVDVPTQVRINQLKTTSQTAKASYTCSYQRRLEGRKK